MVNILVIIRRVIRLMIYILVAIWMVGVLVIIWRLPVLPLVP